MTLIPLICAPLTGKGPELTADRLLNENDQLIAEGDARLKVADTELRADTIVYNKESLKVNASGGVSITQSTGRIIVPEANYDGNERAISAPAFRAGTPPLYLSGDALKGISGTLSAENTVLTYHEPESISLNVRAGKVSYLNSDTLLVEDATLRIGKVPFFYIPRFTQNSRETPLRVRFRAGSGDNLGVHLQTDIFYTQLNEEFEPGVLLDYYGKRGVLIGPAANYRLDAHNGFVEGSLRSGFIRDNGNRLERGADVLGRFINKQREFIQWQHKSRVDDRLELSASTAWWSDSEVLRDFRDDLYNDNQQPDNYGEAVWLDDAFIVSLLARFSPNDFQLVQQRLPELTFTWLPTEVFDSGIYTEAKASASRLIEKNPRGIVAEIRSNRFDYYQGLRKPIPINDWATVTPVVGSRITHYEKTRDFRSSYTRVLGQVGFDAEMTAHRDWDVDDDYWAVHGLRHLVRPRLQYRYLPEAQTGLSSIPQVDANVFNTLVPPIDLANVRDLDNLHELNVVRLGVENSLQTRAAGYGSRTLARLDMFQDYNFSRRANQNDVADLHTEFALSPAYWLNFSLYNRLNPEHLTSQETQARLQLTDADIWSLAFSSVNLDSDIDQYQLEGAYKFTERMTFLPRWRYDARRNEFVEQVYGLRTQVGRSWLVEYALSIVRGDNRNDGFGFSVRLELMGF